MNENHLKHRIWNLGPSTQNTTITADVFVSHGQPPMVPYDLFDPTVLFLGGVHGNEIEGVWLIQKLINDWKKEFPFFKMNAVCVSCLNPDGVVLGQRTNSRGVDLNRNLPTKDWTSTILNPKYPPGPSAGSEPENKVLLELIKIVQPCAILSVHSFEKPQVNLNGTEKKWAEKLSSYTTYPVTTDIGYPTPGSLGTYGVEKNIPTITLELLRGEDQERIEQKLKEIGNITLSYWEEKFRENS